MGPTFAGVRPRVTAGGSPTLLDQFILEGQHARPGWLAVIVAGHGAGKTSALAYAQSRLPDPARLILLDEPRPLVLAAALERGPVLYAAAHAEATNHDHLLRLCPWTPDDLIELALARIPDAKAHALRTALAACARDPLQGTPWVWDRILAYLIARAADQPSPDSAAIALDAIQSGLRSPAQWPALLRLCQRVEGMGKPARGRRARLPRDLVRHLKYHDALRLRLAARAAAAQIKDGDLGALSSHIRLPWLGALGAEIARQDAFAPLLQAARADAPPTRQAWIASLLHAHDPATRPPPGLTCMPGAILPGAKWNGVWIDHANLVGAELAGADLRGATLHRLRAAAADLTGAMLGNGVFNHADFGEASLRGVTGSRVYMQRASLCNTDLTGANLPGLSATGAHFDQADMSDACLAGADLSKARLMPRRAANIDLSGARLDGARLAGMDLRSAALTGTSFHQTGLVNCDLQDMRLDGARMQQAQLLDCDLSGSCFRGADLSGAHFFRCGLAHVDWERADLRHASFTDCSFHAGSSRSGLVGSVIAGHGSRTGFYTDDTGNLNYQDPEAVRKASLRGADLRGARFVNVDFYLVDLRGALCDHVQRATFRAHGAIL